MEGDGGEKFRGKRSTLMVNRLWKTLRTDRKEREKYFRMMYLGRANFVDLPPDLFQQYTTYIDTLIKIFGMMYDNGIKPDFDNPVVKKLKPEAQLMYMIYHSNRKKAEENLLKK